MNLLSRYGMFVLLSVCIAGSPSISQAQEKDDKAADKDKKPAEGAPPKEESSVTEHTIKLGGQTIPYKATAQTILLKDDKGEPTALVYSTAYTRSDVKDPGTRPLAFVYNGGAGLSSGWLHLGFFCPRRVVTAQAAGTSPAPREVDEYIYLLHLL